MKQISTIILNRNEYAKNRMNNIFKLEDSTE